MSLTSWYYIGVTILILDITFIMFYYYYATVKVYNFIQKTSKIERHCQRKKNKTFQNTHESAQEEYYYLGHLWIRKKRGEYYLKIPQEMLDESVTTKYKIVSQSMLHKIRKGDKIHINFADSYHVDTKLAAQITVKNYIATPHQL